MSAIKQSTQPEHTDGMSLYDYLLLQGEEKGMEKGRLLSQFNFFKKSYSKGLELEMIIEITGISEELGEKWSALLQKNPQAEFPEE